MTVETTPVPVFCHLQVSEEFPVAAGLCRTDLRTDPSQPVRLLSLQRHRKYHGEMDTQALCYHGNTNTRYLYLSVCLQGGVVYANYGRPEDFNWLKSAGVSVVGCVVVMRVGGGVSFAEKVWLAERSGAGGALIYPDPADLPQDPRRLGLNTHTAVSEHVTHTHPHTHVPCPAAPDQSALPLCVVQSQVHLGSGDPFTPGFPSFNHTQFPPIQSSGLPLIPALPVSATVAAKLLR